MIVPGADVDDALQCLGAVSVASLPGVKFAILIRLAGGLEPYCTVEKS